MVGLPLDTLIWGCCFDIKHLEICQQNYGLDLLIWNCLATNCSQVTGMIKLTLKARRVRAARGKDGALGLALWRQARGTHRKVKAFQVW